MDYHYFQLGFLFLLLGTNIIFTHCDGEHQAYFEEETFIAIVTSTMRLKLKVQ